MTITTKKGLVTVQVTFPKWAVWAFVVLFGIGVVVVGNILIKSNIKMAEIIPAIAIGAISWLVFVVALLAHSKVDWDKFNSPFQDRPPSRFTRAS